MPKLTFNGTDFELNKYESVLDCLLRNRQYIPYACRAGMCQACLVRAVGCEATAQSSKWIKESLRQKGYTLACQWVPEGDVGVALPSVEEFSVRTHIRSLDLLNARTMRVLLDVEDKSTMFHYYPGQYLTLISPLGIARSYSVANDYEQDQVLEFHVALMPAGEFSGWLFGTARPGDILHMRSPNGDCFYSNPAGEEFPILLAGVGTGLAPLYALLRDALGKGHKGDISLYHGGRSTDHLYYTAELLALQKQHSQFHYFPCVKEATGSVKVKGVKTGALEDVLVQTLDTGALPRTRVFLCGAPAFVHGLRKQLFLKGASSAHIHCDPFLERSAPTGGTK